jgi:hypothetical protein
MTIPSAEPKQTAVLKWGYQSNATVGKTSASIRNSLDKKGKKLFKKKRKCIEAASP